MNLAVSSLLFVKNSIPPKVAAAIDAGLTFQPPNRIDQCLTGHPLARRAGYDFEEIVF